MNVYFNLIQLFIVENVLLLIDPSKLNLCPAEIL